MENTNFILENVTIHNRNITNQYIKSIRSNIKWTLIVYGIFLLIAILIAVTGTTLAWIGVGILAVCLLILTIINYKGLKRSHESLSKFEGAIYNYKFYDDCFKIKYEFNGKYDSDEIKYTQIKQVIRSNGVVTFSLPDHTILFIDENTIEDKMSFEQVYNKIFINCQESLRSKGKKKK